ncbi:MAG TPA: redoxin domain-containing protein, partial [Armatimonadota bacterium]|nr:redoxin domain-containing protein [Armatimonadota bacterium]
MVARAEFAGSPHAPEWPAGFTWLNTDRPLRLHAELRGRVVVLDFWTYGCINCLHVLPELAALDARFRDEPVTVVGVHSHKYPNEAHPAQIREALLRHDVTHPVIVDEDHQIWDSYGVQAWPTLVVIDPAGYIVATFSGEGHGDELTRLVERLLARGREQGTLVAGPPPGTPEIPHLVIRPLSFPGKVLADRAGGRLFIADTHHHRVLITDWRGEVVGFFGGRRGMVDGPYADVRFTNPQGLLLAGASLYIADTGNHMLRTARLSSFHVETALGDGVIGTDRRGGKTGRDQRLNSPWDLAWLDGRLYLAMAGLHQVWVYDPATGEARVALGTGRESLADGPGRRAALAQPSGLASANGMLYVADAETSAIRQYDPRADLVTTLVGAGLFTFGDRDGPLE